MRTAREDTVSPFGMERQKNVGCIFPFLKRLSIAHIRCCSPAALMQILVSQWNTDSVTAQRKKTNCLSLTHAHPKFLFARSVHTSIIAGVFDWVLAPRCVQDSLKKTTHREQEANKSFLAQVIPPSIADFHWSFKCFPILYTHPG